MTQPQSTTVPPYSEPIGQGSYPRYHGLWHLAALGIVSDLQSFESDIWKEVSDTMTQKGARPVRIALIDTSVDYEHPILRDAVNSSIGVDFVSNRRGAFLVPQNVPGDVTDMLKHHLQKYEEEQDQKDQLARDGKEEPGLPKRLRRQKIRVIKSLLESTNLTSEKIVPAAANKAFSSHGTSMAGIIGGRPGIIDVHSPAELSPGRSAPAKDTMHLPYAGVNPFCEIVPISTSADPRPRQTLQALIYAELIEADIIVLATSLAYPGDANVTSAATEPYVLPASGTITLNDDVETKTKKYWDNLDDHIRNVASRRPVLCAAGNSASGLVSYPARLAGKAPGILSVGARTSLGKRASYAPTPDDENPVSIETLSGDGERFDRVLKRLDPFRARANQDEYARLFERGAVEPTAVEAILAPDISGRFGQTGSVFLDATVPDTNTYYDPASLFASFSGTSAAAAIAAGVLSLEMAAGRIARPGAHYAPEALPEELVAAKLGVTLPLPNDT